MKNPQVETHVANVVCSHFSPLPEDLEYCCDVEGDDMALAQLCRNKTTGMYIYRFFDGMSSPDQDTARELIAEANRKRNQPERLTKAHLKKWDERDLNWVIYESRDYMIANLRAAAERIAAEYGLPGIGEKLPDDRYWLASYDQTFGGEKYEIDVYYL